MFLPLYAVALCILITISNSYSNGYSNGYSNSQSDSQSDTQGPLEARTMQPINGFERQVLGLVPGQAIALCEDEPIRRSKLAYS